jgi:hypothetical protein
VRHKQGAPYWHAIARVGGRGGWVRPLHLVSADIAPSSPALRLAEARALALIAKDGMVIARGDWNAKPASDPDPPLDGLDAGHARSRPGGKR